MQKFKGETDEEFERRKKRVRRTRQHSNNGLGNTLAHVGGGGGIVSSLCAFNAVALPGAAYVDLDIDNLNDDMYLTYTDPVTQNIETIANQDNASASSKELVVNGDFSDGLNGWTPRLGTTINNVANELIVDIVNTSGSGVIATDIILEEHRNYSIMTGEVIADTYSPGALISTFGYNAILDSSTLPINNNVINFIGQSIPFSLMYLRGTGGASGTVSIDNISVKEVLPVSTKYRMTNDFSNAVSHDIPFSQADLDLMRADPLTLRRVFFDGLVLPSGFAKVNMKHFYPADEGVGGGANVHDLVTATDAVIQNYTDACRTTYQEVPGTL